MKHNLHKLWLACLVVTTLFVTACGQESGQTVADKPLQSRDEQKISEFGRYEGYSQERFDGWVTTSTYITTRDGTRLAADISRPANNGVVTEEALPVLWSYSRYHRQWEAGVLNITSNPILQRLAKHGYVIVCVNVRGGGASFGRYEGLFSAPETRDAYDVIDWLSKQDFSDGNVGMYGVSYMGITQYMAASTKHPALKAITPENGYFNFYDAIRHGGILHADQVKTWGEGTQYLDKVRKPTPVDADTDGFLAAAAVTEHETNFDPISPLGAAKFRDSTAPEFDWFKDMPSSVNKAVNEAGVAIYHLGAWHDPYTTDTLLHYYNYRGPQKMAFGPWAHEANNDVEAAERDKVYGTEMLRWFDYWLKGINNGVMDEPNINVAEVDTMRESWKWIPMPNFPLDDNRVSYFFNPTTSQGSPKLPADYVLSVKAPEKSAAAEYQVNLDTTTGTATRWDSNFGEPALYPDMTENDARSLTFTTPPMDKDMVIAGIPLVKMYLSASTPDADVYAVLEEVDSSGRSNYITEGHLRVSLRKEGDAPWNMLGIPWHRAYQEDQQMLTSGEVVEINFDIMPVVYRINKGNRLRVAIMGGDKDNMEAPPFPDALLSVKTGGEHASQISLPVMSL
ncbi:CocE/NonD family hydrolase [Microbulbifer hainanensis]|uniref:CocE/NonD family hydrolase n=1 Tax=Microbulbifer hainanensis TaxID=2735675 RepID=UPI001867F0AF|nr:CocE/NonD family hydrolase [Microbulbifer hainanensis]